jgi:translation initiation factor IF-2
MAEEIKIGAISHFFSRISVGIIQLTDGDLKIGDTIRVKGHSTDFTQTIDTLQIEHKIVTEAKKGDAVGTKVNEHVREHDIVYKVL